MKEERSLLSFIERRYIWFFILFIALQSAALFVMFNKNKQELYNRKVAEVSNLLVDSISSPIIQGSNLEAIQRLRSAQNKNLIKCFTFLNPFFFNSCKSNENSYEKAITLNRSGTLISVNFYFEDKMYQINPIWYFFVTIVTLLFFILFNYFFIKDLQKKIRNDFHSTLEIEKSRSLSSFFFSEFEMISVLIKDLFFQKTKLETDKAVFTIAKKVAHDIRSPLAALEIIASEINIGETESDLLKKSIQRIRSIADDLLASKSKDESKDISCINESIEQIILEKSIRYKGSNFSIRKDQILNNQIIYVLINDVQFKRAISNIIDNSVDAGSTIIDLSMTRSERKLSLSIQDNGHGISDKVFSNLFSNDFKSEKLNGNGIGLKSCKEWMLSIGGELEIESVIGKGTEVKLTFPEYKIGPQLSIDLSLYHKIVFADDEEYILDIWRKKLIEKPINIPVEFCTNLTELKAILMFTDKPILVFTDHNFQDSLETGISIIKLFPMHNYILTTSTYNDRGTHIEAAEIPILPKSMITQISFNF